MTTKVSIEFHIWDARWMDGVPHRATPLGVTEDPNELMGMGINPGSALADCREKVARHLDIEPQQIEFWSKHRDERSALRAEQKIQRKLNRWAARAEAGLHQ